MNPNVNDFNNTNTQPLNHQFIDYNAHTTINHTNPFPNQNQSPNINFSADANYAPPASNMNQNFPQQQAFGQQQAQFQVNQGFQAGFPNANVQMNAGPQVTYATQPSVQVVQQQPSIQVVTQPSYSVTTQSCNNVVVMSRGINAFSPTVTIPVVAGQQASRIIVTFVFVFMLIIMIRVFAAFSRF